MKLLHEDEFSCIEFLLDKKGQTIQITYFDIEYSAYFDVYKAQGFLSELHKAGLVNIKSSQIDHARYYSDVFLKKYSGLVIDKDIEGAKKLAISFNLEPLNETLVEQKSIEETWALIDEVLKKEPDLLSEEGFRFDLYDNIILILEVKENLKDYLDQYLKAFRNDELKKPPSQKEDWAKVPYFERDFYRYKKQREILLDIIKKKTELQNPREIRISINNELPVEHLNLGELLACLEKDGIIVVGKYEFSGAGSSGYNIVLSVAEDKIQKTPTKEQTISQSGAPSLVNENGVGYIKLYKQGSKIKIGKTGTRKYRLLEVLLEPLGAAKTIEAIFDAIRVSRDESDSRLMDGYLAQPRKMELIEYAMKELQKTDGLRGKIKLNLSANRRSAWLTIED